MTERSAPSSDERRLVPELGWVLTRRATLGFALAFVLFVTAGIGGFQEQRHVADSATWSMHTIDVVEGSRAVARLIIDAETSERGYLLTGDTRYLGPYDEANRTLFERTAALTRLASDSPRQQASLEALRPVLASKLAELRAAVELRANGNVEAARATLDADPAGGKMQQIRLLLREFQDRERVLLQERIRSGVARGTRVRGLVAVATILGAAIALVSLVGLNSEGKRRLVAEREVTRVEIARQEAAHTLDERNHALALLRDAQAEAEAANRSKDEFLAVLSHELRSPLNAILGWVTMLRKGTLPPEKVTHALKTIERNVHLQTQLVNDLLDVSRITSGKLALEGEFVDVSVLVHVAVENARPAAEAKGLTLDARLAPRSGAVFGDEKRLQQVIFNLLTNAIKFTPNGGRVTISLAAVGGQVVLRVEDSGIGIGKDFLPFVFDRFRQADGSTTRRHGGLGLGLSIVHTLVELHGGRVEAESSGAGKGAAFTVRLPLASPQLALASRERGTDENELSGVDVVVVEDDDDAREALCLVLEDSGARVRACSSATEAMLAIERLSPDLIVSDIGMPGEDGYQFMRRVRARGSVRVPSIAVTGFASRQDEEEAMKSGFDAHIPKPVLPGVLVAKARDLLRRSRSSNA